MCVFCMVNFHYPPAWTLIYKKYKKNVLNLAESDLLIPLQLINVILVNRKK